MCHFRFLNQHIEKKKHVHSERPPTPTEIDESQCQEAIQQMLLPPPPINTLRKNRNSKIFIAYPLNGVWAGKCKLLLLRSKIDGVHTLISCNIK